MSDQQKITEFNQSTEQDESAKLDNQSEEFGWGSFARPPEDWPISRVEDLFEIQKCSADPEELDKEELVRLYSMPAFDDGKEPELTKAGDIGSKKFHVPTQALLFSKLNISKKRFWLVNHSHDEPALCSTEYWPLLPADGLNLEFFLQYFNSDSFINRPRLSTSSTTNSHQRIKSNLFNKVRLPVPPLSEQRKIATVLYTVDRAIEKTEEVITQTERLREGVMQDIFSRGVRGYDDFQETKYGTIPDNWEVKPVREIADRIGSGGTPNTDKEEYYGGDIEWVKTDDLNSGLVESAKTTITSQGLDESAAKLFPVGTVVFAMYGGALGQNGRLGMEAAMNQACCGIVTDESEMNSYLLHQQLIHRKKQLTALSAGTHQQNISQSMIEKFEVFVPPLDEQKEIVDILKSIERTIEANTNEKERLKRLKQALMQDLLSGTVRTTDTNIEVPEEIAQYG